MKRKKKVAAKAKRSIGTRLRKKPSKKTQKKYEHHPDHYNRSENFLIDNLETDLKEAWFKIRELGASLGKKIYASGRAIMFSKKVCYFFVRPKKQYLEVVIFLTNKMTSSNFSSIRAVSKTKFAHTFRLVHSDQIEGELVEAIRESFIQTPALNPSAL